MWPGIPSGKGKTCTEEGCGNERRARGNDCRKCYMRKLQAHRRSGRDDPHSWGKGGYEVAFTRAVRGELDAMAYDDWAGRSDA